MGTGKVKFFNATKGFGFITQENGKDIFFHISEVNGAEPQDGDSVQFEVGESDKGPCALKVTVTGN